MSNTLPQGFSQYFRFSSLNALGQPSVAGATFFSTDTTAITVQPRPNDPDGTAFPDQFRVDAIGAPNTGATVRVTCNGKNAQDLWTVAAAPNLGATNIVGAVGDPFPTPTA